MITNARPDICNHGAYGSRDSWPIIACMVLKKIPSLSWCIILNQNGLKISISKNRFDNKIYKISISEED